jgi:C4-dicarboxylate-specific signal transduction histidine kinase
MARRRPGVWSELGLGLALVTLAAILLNGGMMWLVVRQRAIEQETDAAILLARSLAGELERAPPDAHAAILDRSAGAAAVLFDRDGKALWPGTATPRAPAALLRAVLAREQQIAEDGDLLLVYTPIPRERVPTAVLEVSLVPGLHGVTPSSLGPLLLYTAFTSAIVAAFGAVLLRNAIVRPLRELGAATARIAAGDFGSTVPLEGAREFEELARSLGQLSHALRDYRADTESKVAALERANRELSEAQEAVVRSERLATVGRLAAGIAHELGNPLAAVSGYVDLLALGDTDPLTQDELLARAAREVDRMGRIIRQLLDFARPGPGTPETVDVRAAIEQARDTLVPLQRLKGLTIAVEAPGQPALVRIEPDRLHQVLVNVLLNAGDAVDGAPGGGVTVTVTVTAGDRIAIACEDTGPGFTPDALAHATEPFFTTKDVGAGTGLGLAVSDQLVRAAGGTLTLANRAGRSGARVVIELPRAR